MKENPSLRKMQAVYDAFEDERLRWLIGKGDVLVQKGELDEDELNSLIKKTVEEEFVRCLILGSLQQSSKTTTEVSKDIHLETSVVHWNLLALRRWNKVEIVEQKVDEYVYSIKAIH